MLFLRFRSKIPSKYAAFVRNSSALEFETLFCWNIRYGQRFSIFVSFSLKNSDSLCFSTPPPLQLTKTISAKLQMRNSLWKTEMLATFNFQPHKNTNFPNKMWLLVLFRGHESYYLLITRTWIHKQIYIKCDKSICRLARFARGNGIKSALFSFAGRENQIELLEIMFV